MGALRVGFIGTGKKPEKASAMGFGMAQQHAVAYRPLKGRIEIVAVADIARENAEDFCERHGVPKSGIYSDYHEMLAKEKLDVVNIATWPHLHAPMVIACAEARVRGVYCEKPMADSWGAAKRMHAACAEHGVQLAFNHQRRYGKPFRRARQLIDEGAIGSLQRLEFAAGNIYDYGTHSIDLTNYLNGDRGAKWVLAQIDYRQEQLVFGAHCENQAIVQWEYENGVFGLGSTGPGSAMVAAHNRVIGADGIIEIGPRGPGEHPQLLRIRRFGQGAWEYLETEGEGCHGPGYIERALSDFITCLEQGRACEVSSAHALRATEIIFAAYESSRRHGRVDLPLRIDDHPLAEMVRSGILKPKKA